MRAIVPRPNKAPRCVQKRPRISHAKLKLPLAFTTTLGSPTPIQPLGPITLASVVSMVLENGLTSMLITALIVRAARGRSHRIEADSPLPLDTSSRPVHPFLRHFLSSRQHDMTYVHGRRRAVRHNLAPCLKT